MIDIATVTVPDGPPYRLRLRHDGAIELTRDIAGDGRRTVIRMDAVVARLVADGLHDAADRLDEQQEDDGWQDDY